MDIALMLNPEIEGEHWKEEWPCSAARVANMDAWKVTLPGRTHKKDGKVATQFKRAVPQGPVRYPPCDTLDEGIAHQLRKFHVYPFGEIQQYPRHIPYSSDKKGFLEKTGRGAFESKLLRKR